MSTETNENPPENLYNRLQSTLAPHNINRSTAQLLALQLVDGVPHEDVAGINSSGHIHLGALFEAKTDVHALLSHLSELSLSGTYVNGSGASFVGLIGGAKSGSINRGVALSGKHDHLYIGKASTLDEQIKEAFEQILSRGNYTITKSGIHETCIVDSSILFADTLRGGNRDGYAPLSEELDYLLPPAPRYRCDVVFVDAGKGEKITATEPSLTTAEAHTGFEAARKIEPTIPDLILEEMQARHETKIDGISGAPPISFESFRRLVTARTRLDYNATVKKTHVDEIVDLCDRLRQNMGLLDDASKGSETTDTQPNSDMIVVDETDSVNSPPPQHVAKRIIDDLETTDRGAPLDKTLRRLQIKLGCDEESAQNYIDKLLDMGDLYLPKEDRLRLT